VVATATSRRAPDGLADSGFLGGSGHRSAALLGERWSAKRLDDAAHDSEPHVRASLPGELAAQRQTDVVRGDDDRDRPERVGPLASAIAVHSQATLSAPGRTSAKFKPPALEERQAAVHGSLDGLEPLALEVVAIAIARPAAQA